MAFDRQSAVQSCQTSVALTATIFAVIYIIIFTLHAVTVIYFCWCCPAGGLFGKVKCFVFIKTRFPFLLMRAASILKNNAFPFFGDVALRAASILKNHDFPFWECCPAGGVHVAKHLFLAGFEPRECLRTVSFEKCWCTSQRLKWTSGARVMIVLRRFTHEWSFSL